MAGLCEGGNEPPSSLKVNFQFRLHQNPQHRQQENPSHFFRFRPVPKVDARKIRDKRRKYQRSEARLQMLKERIFAAENSGKSYVTRSRPSNVVIPAKRPPSHEYHSGSQCNSLVFEVKLDIPTISPADNGIIDDRVTPQGCFKKKERKKKQASEECISHIEKSFSICELNREQKNLTQTNTAMDLVPDNVKVYVPPPKFICITLTGTEKTMKNISPFYIRRALDGLVGKVKNATRLRNGSLLVETLSAKQSETLLKAKLLGSYLIKAERHSSLNTTRGVVHTDALDGMSDEEIQLELADQSVSKAYHLLRKGDGRTYALSTVFLTFEKPLLPEYIFVGCERVPVRAYVPNQMRCFRCQRFGHTQKRNTNEITCAKCGSSDHRDSPCPNTAHCVNCERDHAANSKDCPKYQVEKAIQELRVRGNVTFFEARKRYFE
ncbi:hypothetical protein ANN_24483 [Periplaneta americana]|uniref:Gag-like protein n=1 Tax=Periplaneta americana TaxID=6978 RepID=A0ABQ8S3I9_PERAM|nr:hypothetical protein ANN_24483 [Periplaneta americana]